MYYILYICVHSIFSAYIVVCNMHGKRMYLCTYAYILYIVVSSYSTLLYLCSYIVVSMHSRLLYVHTLLCLRIADCCMFIHCCVYV